MTTHLQSTRNAYATDPLTFLSEAASQIPNLKRIGGTDDLNSARKKRKSYATDRLTILLEIASQKRQEIDSVNHIEKNVIFNQLKSVMLGTVIEIKGEDELLRSIFNLHDAIKAIIAIGGDVNARNQEGITPLHWAIEKGELEIVRELLANGADINATYSKERTAIAYGRTALLWAIEKGELEIVRELLASGADIKATDNTGITALHWAIEKGELEIVRELLASGADIKATDNTGITALHMATEEGNVEIVQLLIASGAV